MYRFWTPVIGPLLEYIAPKVVVEIGSDQGFNTRNLVDLCRRHDAVLHVIDPLPKYNVDEWLEQYSPNLVFHRTISLEALGSIDHPDVVLIDGDHNWHTVINELKFLEKTAGDGAFPIVLLHDIGWPYGRRDLYYDPDRIPSPDRQSYRKEGMRPGRRDLDPEGGLNAHLFNAVIDGGPRNGVLTAVEDFMDATPMELELMVVPGINSLGILYPPDLAAKCPGAYALIDELRSSDVLRQLLERVEAMRVESQIDALEAQKVRDQLRTTLAQEQVKLGELQKRYSAVDKVRARLAGENLQIAHQRDKANADKEQLRADKEQLRADKEQLRSEVAALQQSLETDQSQHATVREELLSTQQRLTAADRNYRRLRTRRVVRFALRLADVARPIFKMVRSVRKAGRQRSEASASSVSRSPKKRAPGTRAQARLARAIAANRPGSPATEGPLVSIIVLTRDGADHLRRLLPTLDDVTTYRSFEVIVVDNASSDDTAEVLATERGYPLTVIRNERNTSFSEGNNHAADQARGEFLLFLNNDIEPVNAGWLGAMVDAARKRDGTVAVGAELVYPIRGIPAKDLTVQHIGISFTFRHGAVHPINVKANDPLDPRLEGIRSVPAATAAALLVDEAVFRSVGGFDEGYVYGTEDVDLCLRLDQLGEVVVTGQAVLFHHESATQSQIADEITGMNRLRNHQRFAEHWGPRLSRTMLLERFGEIDRFGLSGRRKVAITLTHDEESRGWGDYYTAHGLGDAFEEEGWEVVYAERYQDHWYELPGEVDLVISLLDAYDVRNAPEGAFTVAWVRNWVDRWLDRPWFDTFDMVVTSSHKASGLISEQSRFVPPVIGMATDSTRFSPGPVNPTFRSDYVFTGNNWGAGRSIVDILDIHPGEEFLLFGKGWDKDPRMRRYWRGHLSHELLPEVYRSAKIVLDDTAAPTLPYAFLNGRVFDALASGTLVLTDNVDGSREFFDGLLPTYSSREELREHLDRFLDGDIEREALVDELSRRVLESHTYKQRATVFLDVAREQVTRPRAAIKIAVPYAEVSEMWGDTHFASGLAWALTAAGMPTEVHLLPEWDLPASQAVDVVITLRGLANYVPRPSHVNVLWIISHPDDVTVRECEKYDVVLVASKSHAEWLDAQADVPVIFMPQATDHRRFQPVAKVPEFENEVLFLGNSRGQRREAVAWAIQKRLPLTVYGSMWEGRIPSDYIAAEHFPNRDLASLYASAKVVLNDHWPDMRDRGFVSNRIFDALASGAVVVSDPSVGLKDLFDDIVPTFSSPEELAAVVHLLLDDPEEREARAKRGAELVLSEHTFQRRAEVIMGLIQSMLERREIDMDGGTFGSNEIAR